MTPDISASLLSALVALINQMPMVAMLLWVFIQREKAHSNSIDYYRNYNMFLVKWSLAHIDKTIKVNDDHVSGDGG